jgi:hypothetical protein
MSDTSEKSNDGWVTTAGNDDDDVAAAIICDRVF